MTPNSKHHVMVDLETFGTGPNAVIVSIGACKFDPHNKDVEMQTFHCNIDPRSCQKYGMDIDAECIMWWFKAESEKARDAITKGVHVDIASALDGFSYWFGEQSLPLWGNGANFDNVILRNAFIKTNTIAPWTYNHDRCYRTLKNFQHTGRTENSGFAHHALWDAINQAKHLQTIVAELGLTLT